jgi:hypothetical protein
MPEHDPALARLIASVGPAVANGGLLTSMAVALPSSTGTASIAIQSSLVAKVNFADFPGGLRLAPFRYCP